MRKRALYVGFSRAKSPWKIGSTLIRWAESPRSLFGIASWFSLYPASHVFASFPATDKRPFYVVNEAAGTMIRFVSQPHFEDHATITSLYRLEVTEDIFDHVQLYGALHAGAPYAFLENVGIALVRLVQAFTNRNIPNPFGVGDRAQKCSEFVMRGIVERFVPLKELSVEVYNATGYKLPADIELLGVRDLCEIFEFLSTQGRCTRVKVDSPMREQGSVPRAA